MRILITGYTTRMFGSDRVAMDYITFSFLLEDILKEMGHEVHRKKVLIGDNLSSKYDFAFCGVAPLSSMTSGRVCETHYTMLSMQGRHVVYADDWSFCGYGDSVRYTLEKWDKYLKYKKFPYDTHVTDALKNHLEFMMSADEGNNAPVLAPMFPWGNHKFLMTGVGDEGNYKAKLITIDPSKWLKFPRVEIPEPKDKVRQWVMAALSDHSSWIKKQNLKLPVKYVGNKRMDGVEILAESDTVRLFANSFGVLSTGYPSAGSGWWRTRYLNAAWAESIVYSDPKDCAVMGAPYQGTAESFENITSDNEYQEVVSRQNNWLQHNISEKPTTLTILERLMAK